MCECVSGFFLNFFLLRLDARSCIVIHFHWISMLCTIFIFFSLNVCWIRASEVIRLADERANGLIVGVRFVPTTHTRARAGAYTHTQSHTPKATTTKTKFHSISFNTRTMSEYLHTYTSHYLQNTDISFLFFLFFKIYFHSIFFFLFSSNNFLLI